MALRAAGVTDSVIVTVRNPRHLHHLMQLLEMKVITGVLTGVVSIGDLRAVHLGRPC